MDSIENPYNLGAYLRQEAWLSLFAPGEPMPKITAALF